MTSKIVTIGEVVDTKISMVDPKLFPKLEYFGMEHIEPKTGIIIGNTNPESMKSKSRIFQKNDVVYGTLRPYLQKCFIAKKQGLCSSTFLQLRPKDDIFPGFLHLLLLSPLFTNYANKNSFGDRPTIKKPDVLKFEFYLPDLSEQKRIVEKINVNLNLARNVKKSLSSQIEYQQTLELSIFNSIFEGGFLPTNESRSNIDDSDRESAKHLLDRILTKRQEQFELENPRRKYKPPIEPNLNDVPKLPDGWCWTNLDQLASFEKYSITDGPFGSNLKTEHYTTSGPLVVRLQNIGEGEFIRNDAHITYERFELLKKHSINQGDLVIASFGNEVPRACIIPEIGPAIVKADCIKFTPNKELVIPKLLMYFLNSQLVRRNAKSKIHGVGRPRIGLTLLKGVPIPLPPFPEQIRILSKLERIIGELNEVRKLVNESQEYSLIWEDSILADSLKQN